MTCRYYLVGGAVRDKLLGINSKDLDYAVECSSFEELKQDILDRGGQIFLEKPEFSTIRAKLNGEFADFVVCKSNNLALDLSRRDFTFNALALNKNNELIDMFDGVAHLHNRVLKTPLPAMTTFADDPLRVLRAVRFAVKYGCVFSEDIVEAIENPKLPELMGVVSLDRIRDELYKAMKFDSFRTLKLLAGLPDLLVKSWIRDGLWLMPTTKE
jgi:tRNA nucleotidyltransferase/poly(A) polymerase